MPPAPYVKQTLTELLRDGYKFYWRLVFNTKLEDIVLENVYTKLVNETVNTKEDFNDNILNLEKYWWPPIYANDIKNRSARIQQEEWRIKHQKMIMFAASESLKQTRIDSDWVSKEKCERLNILCHGTKTTYAEAPEIAWIHSKVRK